MTFISESNLYRVIFQSRKQEAEKFTDWVTEEVLPQIRRTGGYGRSRELAEALDVVREAASLLKQQIALSAMRIPVRNTVKQKIKDGLYLLPEMNAPLEPEVPALPEPVKAVPVKAEPVRRRGRFGGNRQPVMLEHFSGEKHYFPSLRKACEFLLIPATGMTRRFAANMTVHGYKFVFLAKGKAPWQK